MMPAWEQAVIQRAKTKIMGQVVVTVIMVKRPTRSPSQPGMTRPKIL